MFGCTAWLRPLPGRQARAGGAASRFGVGLCYALQSKLLRCHGAEGMNGPSYPWPIPNIRRWLTSDPASGRWPMANRARDARICHQCGRQLTDEQVDALVHGMRAAWYKARHSRWCESAAVPAPPSRLIAARGQQVYAAFCAGCHGPPEQQARARQGRSPSRRSLALIRDQALRTIIIAGRPDLGQPDWRNDMPGHPMSDRR